MKILYYDCFAGISGDMNLAAMIDLGVEPEYLRSALSKLGLDHEFELKVSADSRHGICGTRVDVELKNQDSAHDHNHHGHEHGHGDAHEHGHHDHDHNHGHEYGHEHHGHSHGHGHEHAAHAPDHPHSHADHDHVQHSGHEHGHDHVHDSGHTHGHAHCHHGHAAHRNLADIEAIIMASTLADAIKETSLAIFRKVAQAESKVHGKPIDEVHFHEVGATDSIVDIVGAAICLHRLGVDAVWASPVELGGGFVRCAHGLIPVPAPATIEILHGVPTTRGKVQQETTTPTGAAILAALVEKFIDSPEMITEKTAYGIGHRESEIPNALRVHLAEAALPETSESGANARLLQCNIDDMTAEMLGAAMDLLMEKGARDVHFTAIQMKKNRPGTCLSLLCDEADEARFKELLFRHTTTLGIKSIRLHKTALDISFEQLDTPLGSVTMKNAILDGRIIRSKPELEECRDIARRNDMPLSEVYAVIEKSRK
ncbi:nickel pincer cofactor biosynthesis protein LarC [Oceanidesulfovibrio marinus]|uniref:Putative nickel insertion protein n=1 Tax=Oceanidesulfovibrio marinus TaxID=370038 RepID=A0ABX6NDQ7_9BACT|nr:nickel pincer cofactor biosynthesis protein LarC [Oceanidesulfovibrio marinus]QJT08731.1 nickel pincer cofactor biosynthesis protein LarC [Oceanidesulfovibrio marinus]